MNMEPIYTVDLYCQECDRLIREVSIGKDCQIRVPVCKSCRNQDRQKDSDGYLKCTH